MMKYLMMSVFFISLSGCITVPKAGECYVEETGLHPINPEKMTNKQLNSGGYK